MAADSGSIPARTDTELEIGTQLHLSYFRIVERVICVCANEVRVLFFCQVAHRSLSGLRSWQAPAVPASVFSADQFRVFLPPKNKEAVGDTWWIIASDLNIFTGYLPNNRYTAPPPRGKEVYRR